MGTPYNILTPKLLWNVYAGYLLFIIGHLHHGGKFQLVSNRPKQGRDQGESLLVIKGKQLCSV